MKFRPVLLAAVAAGVLAVSAFAQLAADVGDLRARAERGDAKAQLALGRALVGSDPVEAFAWLALAVERGENAPEHAKLFSELSPAQYAAAEKKSAEFRTRFSDGAATVVPASVSNANEIEALKAQVQKLSSELETARALAEGAAVARARLAAVEKDLLVARTDAAVRDTRTGEATTQLRRDLDAAMQQRDALAEQISQIRRDKASAEMDREALRAELAAARAQPAPAVASASGTSTPAAAPAAATDTTELERALHEAQLKVDMTVRAFALKDEESQRSQLKAEQAAAAQLAAEHARDEAIATAKRAEADLAASKQAEAGALAAKAQMQNDLYAAQVRIENLSRAFSRQGGVAPAYAAQVPAPVPLESAGATVAAKPAVSTPASPASVAGTEATPASAGPRTHKVTDGETLSSIAFRYYGSASKWDKIFAANRSKLKSADHVAPGVVLVIP